jgi:MFS family permease
VIQAPLGNWRLLAEPRVALMLALGFSSGLPLLLVLGTFSTRLAFSDVDIKAIGLFSYLALPYTLKFLWAPLIDRFDVPVLAPRLGRRRAWMVATQLAVAAALAAMAFADPKTSLALLGLGAFLVAVGAATQDVVIDGWRIDAAGTEMQGVMAATASLGYRLALMMAGAGALFLAYAYGWTFAYLTMAALMGVGILAALLSPRIDRTDSPEAAASADASHAPAAAPVWSFHRAILEPLAELYRRMGHGLWAILVLVALYRMPDFISGVMASPLYRTVGFSLAEIGAVSKLYGIWVGIAGAFVGGWAITRYGLTPNPGHRSLSRGRVQSRLLVAVLRRPGGLASHGRDLDRQFLRLLRGHRADLVHVRPHGAGLRGDAIRALLLALRTARKTRRRPVGLHRRGLRLSGVLRADRPRSGFPWWCCAWCSGASARSRRTSRSPRPTPRLRRRGEPPTSPALDVCPILWRLRPSARGIWPMVIGDFEILDDRFKLLVKTAAKVEKLYTGCRWAEGPAYFPAGRYVLWSDIPNDRILRFDETTGVTGVFRQPAGHSNGNVVDRQGRLVTCEHGGRRVSRTEHDGSITLIADRFEGKRLNSPNDVVVKSDGSIWFTDPAYGIDSDYEGHKATARSAPAMSTGSIPASGAISHRGG